MTKPESSNTKDSDSEEQEEIHLEIENAEQSLKNCSPSGKQDKKRKQTPRTARQLISTFSHTDSEDNEGETTKKHSNGPPNKKAKAAENINNKKYVPKYKKEWEDKAELKAWLSESIHGNTYFYCKFCKKDYRCGISDINKHMSSKKHMMRAALPTFEAQRFKFRGLLCPVFTPFVSTRSIAPDINFKAIPKYANFLNICKVKGILLNDIVGEGMSLTIRERIETTECWVDACEKNNQFLMVQIGGAPLKDVIEMAKHACMKDVGAVVILPDLYNKPKNHIDLIKYIKIISEFTKHLPILYHHNPSYAHVDFDISTFLIDITGEVDSFVGVIYSTNDLQKSAAALCTNREKYTIFLATEQAVLAAAATGFSCIMSTSLNFLPKIVESIYEDVTKGDLKHAQTSQSLLNKTIDQISKEGDPVAVFKTATNLITNTCGTMTREPIQFLWEASIKKMQTKLHELGLV